MTFKGRNYFCVNCIPFKTMENNMNQEENKKNLITPILAVLLLASVGMGIYMYMQNSELTKQLAECGTLKDSETQEKNKVIGELENMLTQYDSLSTSNDSINQELLAERTKIERLLKEAKNNKWTIYKLRKEASTLREIMKGYVVTIDSLNTLNVELQAENVEVNRRYNEQKETNAELEEKNKGLGEKVRLGAKLKAMDMVAYAQRVKNNGVHRETNRSSKAQKIKTCFTVDKNDVIESGKKKIYLRIISPNGKVLAERTDASNMFQFEGTKGLFSVTKVFNYENAEIDICMYWDVKDALVAGEYIVEAYVNQLQIGKTTFTLK